MEILEVSWVINISWTPSSMISLGNTRFHIMHSIVFFFLAQCTVLHFFTTPYCLAGVCTCVEACLHFKRVMVLALNCTETLGAWPIRKQLFLLSCPTRSTPPIWHPGEIKQTKKHFATDTSHTSYLRHTQPVVGLLHGFSGILHGLVWVPLGPIRTQTWQNGNRMIRQFCTDAVMHCGCFNKVTRAATTICLTPPTTTSHDLTHTALLLWIQWRSLSIAQN